MNINNTLIWTQSLLPIHSSMRGCEIVSSRDCMGLRLFGRGIVWEWDCLVAGLYIREIVSSRDCLRLRLFPRGIVWSLDCSVAGMIFPWRAHASARGWIFSLTFSSLPHFLGAFFLCSPYSHVDLVFRFIFLDPSFWHDSCSYARASLIYYYKEKILRRWTQRPLSIHNTVSQWNPVTGSILASLA